MARLIQYGLLMLHLPLLAHAFIFSAPICGIVDLTPHISAKYSKPFDVAGYHVTFTCSSGYYVDGNSIFTCTCDSAGQNCTYNGTHSPGCKRQMYCSTPSTPDHGSILPSAPFTSHGSLQGTEVHYSCSSGYGLKGDSSRICEPTGQWTGTSPVCAIRCSQLTDPTNGHVHYLDTSLTVGSTVYYRCDTDYSVHGSRARVCQSTGQWTGTAAVCMPVCAKLQNPTHGTATETVPVDKYVTTFTCESGYVLHGMASITCLTPEKWSGSEPTCVTDCGDPPIIHHGYVRTTSTMQGGMAIYRCYYGYALDSSAVRTCQSTGNWSSTAPNCVLDCRGLETPAHGYLTLHKTIVGSTAGYTCASGYTLQGDQNRTCQASGHWSGSAPTCVKECTSLSNPNHGHVVAHGTTEGSTATYSCDGGYGVSGSSTRTCQSTGYWSGTAAQCVRDCGTPPALPTAEGYMHGSDTIYGSRITYICHTGYVMIGIATHVCQSNGLWSGSTPRCVHSQTTHAPTQCQVLHSMVHGHVTAGHSIGSTATYTCSSGYAIRGADKRTCQPNGQWSGSEPYCVVDCGSLPNPLHGHVSAPNTSLHQWARYTCNTGYHLIGHSSRFCYSTGVWYYPEPTCVRDCGNLQNPSHGYVRDPVTTAGSTASYQCNTGYGLSHTHNRTCSSSGSWSGTEPKCLIDCGQPALSSTNQVISSPHSTEGSTATYSCTHGYVLFGNATRTCQSSGQWSDSAPPCVLPTTTHAPIVNCRRLQDIPNGLVNHNTITVGSVATYTCQTGFKLIGQSSTTCEPSGLWSGDEPLCTAPVKLPAPTALQCRTCEKVSSLDHCNMLIQCNDDEDCYMDHVENSVTRQSHFTGGCRSKLACQSSHGRRSDHVICSECCDNKTAILGCNSHLCGIKQAMAPPGIQCLQCDSPVYNMSACQNIKTCNSNEMCIAKTFTSGNVFTYQSDCFNKDVCLKFVNIIGQKRSVITDKRDVVTRCNMCCGDDGCNAATCEELEVRLEYLYQHRQLDLGTLKKLP